MARKNVSVSGRMEYNGKRRKKMDLSQIRNEIDRVDRELLPLFLRRMELSGKVAEYKAQNDLPIYNEEREKEILSQIAEKSGDLSPYAVGLYSEILRLSRSYQEELISPIKNGKR